MSTFTSVFHPIISQGEKSTFSVHFYLRRHLDDFRSLELQKLTFKSSRTDGLKMFDAWWDLARDLLTRLTSGAFAPWEYQQAYYCSLVDRLLLSFLVFFFFFYPSPPHKFSCLIEQLAHMHTAFSAAINHIPGVLGHSNDAWLPAPTDHLPVWTINPVNKLAAGPCSPTVELSTLALHPRLHN